MQVCIVFLKDTNVSSSPRYSLRGLKKGSETLETRTTRPNRTRWLYFIPLSVLVLGLVFLVLASTQPYTPGRPDTPLDVFFWDGGLFLIAVGVLSGIIVLGLYLSRARARKILQ